MMVGRNLPEVYKLKNNYKTTYMTNIVLFGKPGAEGTQAEFLKENTS
jgi:hypothetical protein